jgi:hypothetical protein
MHENPAVQCPFCGHIFEVLLVEAAGELELDCENCCRPLQLRLTWAGDEILSLDVSAGW